MEKIILEIKDKDGELLKQVEANTFELSFGTIDSLMELLDISEKTTSFEVLRRISTAWKEVTAIFDEVFPGVTKEEWRLVKINDLLPIILQVVKYTFSEMFRIPTSSKN